MGYCNGTPKTHFLFRCLLPHSETLALFLATLKKSSRASYSYEHLGLASLFIEETHLECQDVYTPVQESKHTCWDGYF